MRIGILSDTHDRVARTRRAVGLLRDAGAEALVHCGDLASPPIVEICAVLPCWFVFGNHDADAVAELRLAAATTGAICLDYGGVFELGGKRIGVTHGHMLADKRRVLSEPLDYLFTGHSHSRFDEMFGAVRRINPGALHRADEFTVAVLDLETGALEWLRVDENR